MSRLQLPPSDLLDFGGWGHPVVGSALLRVCCRRHHCPDWEKSGGLPGGGFYLNWIGERCRQSFRPREQHVLEARKLMCSWK